MEKESTLFLTSLNENYKWFEDYANSAILSDIQKEELREKNKVDKLNEVKKILKEFEKEDCAIISINKVLLMDYIVSFKRIKYKKYLIFINYDYYFL